APQREPQTRGDHPEPNSHPRHPLTPPFAPALGAGVLSQAKHEGSFAGVSPSAQERGLGPARAQRFGALRRTSLRRLPPRQARDLVSKGTERYGVERAQTRGGEAPLASAPLRVRRAQR